MIFASLGNFSNNVESALIPCYDLNIDKYIQKSKEIFDWVEIEGISTSYIYLSKWLLFLIIYDKECHRIRYKFLSLAYFKRQR